MNKEDGLPFRETIGAEILYCEKLEAWVFRHPKITTSPFDSEEEVNREEEVIAIFAVSSDEDPFTLLYSFN